MSATISNHDVANLDRIMGGYGDWFSADLFRLILKADFENRARLRLAFSDHVRLVELWQNRESDEAWADTVGAMITEGI